MGIEQRKAWVDAIEWLQSSRDKQGAGKALRCSASSWNLIVPTLWALSKFTIKAPKDSAAWKWGSCRSGGDLGSLFWDTEVEGGWKPSLPFILLDSKGLCVSYGLDVPARQSSRLGEALKNTETGDRHHVLPEQSMHVATT